MKTILPKKEMFDKLFAVKEHRKTKILGNHKRVLLFRIFVIISCILSLNTSIKAFSNKPTPDEAIQMLKEGNKRFVHGESIHPNLNFARIRQAGKVNQRDHAYTTIVACSDSRVPVELLFDAGIMDIFVIRVAGNVVGINEAGSIEYGLAHVKTPVLLVLGHTQCGAVTAVTHSIQGAKHSFEENIQNLVSDIKPAVKRAIHDHPGIHGDDIIPFSVEENVLESIKNLFMMSPTARDLVKNGSVKVVGAIYDVSTGRVRWMPESTVERILVQVEASPEKVVSKTKTKPYTKDVYVQDKDTKKDLQPKPIDAPHMENITLLEKSEFFEMVKAQNRKAKDHEIHLPVDESGISLTTKFIILLIVSLSLVGVGFRTKIISKIGIRNELYLAFFVTIVTTLFVGMSAYYMLYTTQKESDIALASLNLDILTNEMHRLQEEFLLTGIENIKKGDEIVEEHKKVTTAYRAELKKLLQFDMDSVELQSIQKIQSLMKHYSESFLDLVERFRAVEFHKTEMEDLSDRIGRKLKKIIVKHEEYFANIKVGTAPSVDWAVQTRLVEELRRAEMISFKVSREETEFLLDKHFDRIDALEKEIGNLYGSLKTAENLVPLLHGDDIDKKAELEKFSKVKALIAKYVEDISHIIKDEMIVGADLVDSEEDLKFIEANFAALGKRAEIIVAKTKSEYKTVFIILMVIYVFGGAYLAITQTGEIIAPIKKASDIMQNMCKGDFSQRLNLEREDEMGQFAKSLDCLADKAEKVLSKSNSARRQP